MAVRLKVHIEPLPDGSWPDGVQHRTFDEMYRACRRDLVALCERLLCGRGDAEAIAQEAFVRAWTSLDRFSSERPFWPWLATIARRLCIDNRRRLAREAQHGHLNAERHAHAAGGLPEEGVEVKEEYRSAYEALRCLKPAEQRVIALRELNGWSYEEIADFEGVTVESVRGSLKRARTSLRRSYAKVAGGAPALLGFRGRLGLRARIAVCSRRALRVPSGYASPIVTSLPEAVALVVSLITVLGSQAAPPLVPSQAEPAALDFAAPAQPMSFASGDKEPTRRPGAVDDASTPGPLLSDDTAGALGSLWLLDDGADAPEQTWITTMTSSPNAETDGVAFAGATVTGCSAVTCAALFRTRDHGRTWVRLPAVGFLGGEIVLSPWYPADPRIFVAGPGGLQLSRDGGETFTTVVPMGASGAAIAVDASAVTRILVSGSGVWEYDDDSGLAAPAPLAFGPSLSVNDVRFLPGDNGHSVLVGAATVDARGKQRAAVHRCEHAVCAQSTSLGETIGAPSLAVSPTFEDDGRVFAWRGNALFRSDDGGSSFEAVALPGEGAVRSVVFDVDVVYVGVASTEGGGRSGVLASRDGGRTWESLGVGTAVGEGVEALAVLGRGRLLAAPVIEAHGGLACSIDGGQTWERRCAS